MVSRPELVAKIAMATARLQALQRKLAEIDDRKRARRAARAERRARIEAAYVANEATVEEIATAFATHRCSIQRWARQGGWQRRNRKSVVARRPRDARLQPGEGAIA